MKVIYYNGKEETLNPQLKNITKIITGKGETETQVQLYGSTKELLGFDNLNEYGWEFLTERAVEKDPLTFFSDDFKTNVIGESVLDIENFRNTLMITLTDDPKSISRIGYFGTISARKQKLLMFKCDPGNEWANLYEGDSRKIKITFEGDEIKTTKLIWIVFTFGGKETVSDINLSSMIWESLEEPARNMKDYLFKLSEVDREVDPVEKTFDSFWFDRGADILLGNKETEEKETPIYNTIKKEVEGNQFWERDVRYPRGAKVVYGGSVHYWYKGKYHELPFSIGHWKNNIKYNAGDLCKYGDKEYIALTISTNVIPNRGDDIWAVLKYSQEKTNGSLVEMPTEYESLIDDNRGNNPILSKNWIKSSYINSIPRERGRVILKSKDAAGKEILEVPGVVEPGLFTFPIDTLKLNILVTEGFIYEGFSEKENYLLYKDNGREIKELTFISPTSKVELGFKKYNCNVTYNKTSLGKIPLGEEQEVLIPYNQNSDGINKVVLRKKAGDIIEDVEITNYEVLKKKEVNSSVKLNLHANLPCSYEYLIDWYFAYIKVSIIGYLGFYVDKLVDYKLTPDTLMTFRLAPMDGRKHKVKIIFGKEKDDFKIIAIDEMSEGANKNKYSTHIIQSFSTGTGAIEFTAEKMWKGYYTLVVHGTSEDREIKVEIVE